MTKIQELLTGSIASSTTATIFSPLECVKTRLQVQADPSSNLKKMPSSFVKALVQIFKSDGIRLTWSHGFIGFVGRDFFYSGVRIGMYPTVRSFYAGVETERNDINLITKILAGATTGGVGAAMANPFDVVRVRMTVEGGTVDAVTGLLTSGMKEGQQPQYRNSFHCFKNTLLKEGVVHGLFRGVEATAARAALLSAGQLSSYDHSKQFMVQNGIFEKGSNPLHLTAAVLSGLVACTVCNPADVMKSRLMLARSEGNTTTIFNVARSIWKQDGLFGFWRGFGPAYCRAGPSFFIQMPIVEGLRNYFDLESL